MKKVESFIKEKYPFSEFISEWKELSPTVFVNLIAEKKLFADTEFFQVIYFSEIGLLKIVKENDSFLIPKE